MIAALKRGAVQGLALSALVLACPLAMKIGLLIGQYVFNHHGSFWMDPR